MRAAPPRPKQDEHALEYLEGVLLWCGEHPDLGSWQQLRVDHAADIDAIRATASEDAPALGSLHGAAQVVADHVTEVLAGWADLPPLVAWAAAARAIDDAWGDMFADEWPGLLAARGNLVAPGQIVVLVGHDAHLRSIYGAQASFAAGITRRADHPTMTARSLLFAPAQTVPPVRFDDTFATQLPDVMEGADLFATAHPNATTDELRLERFPVRPVDPPEHVERCVGLVAGAFEAGASLVALPEFTGYDAVTDELRGLRPTRPALVVAGSGHHQLGAVRDNASLLWVARSERIVPADKPARVRKRVPYDGGLGREELNHVASEITVFSGGPWRLVVGICRDLCDDRVVDALVQLGVNLLVVPACSPKTANIADSAARVATGSPGISLVSNGPRWFPGRPTKGSVPPPSVDVPLGICCGPIDRQEPRQTQTCEPPDLCLFHLQQVV